VAVRLLDTNIVSFVMKGHTLAARYQPHLTGHTLAVSFMTVAELLEGAALAGWGARRMATLGESIGGLLVLNRNGVSSEWQRKSARDPFSLRKGS